MNIFVLLKMIPDTVEELTVGPDEKSLEQDYLRFKLSDSDEHALEQAILLKEGQGGTVTVAALDAPEADDALFTALAKGADRAVKLMNGSADGQAFGAARAFASFLRSQDKTIEPDTLILLRSQASDELDGEIAPLVADLLGLPYLGVVTGVVHEGNEILGTKEFAEGLRGEYRLPLPAVLGIQSAEKPPRYVPFSKVRSATKTRQIETVESQPAENPGRLVVEKLYRPQVAERAEMIEGPPETVADRIVELLKSNSLI